RHLLLDDGLLGDARHAVGERGRTVARAVAGAAQVPVRGIYRRQSECHADGAVGCRAVPCRAAILFLASRHHSGVGAQSTAGPAAGRPSDVGAGHPGVPVGRRTRDCAAARGDSHSALQMRPPLTYLTAAGERAGAILPLTWFTLLVSIVVCALIALVL